jgi:hypothetical protein
VSSGQIPLLSFDVLRRELEAAAIGILERAPQGNINAALPTVALERGDTKVTCQFKLLPASDFQQVVKVLGGCFRQLGKLRAGYRGCQFEADLYSDYERKRYGDRRIKEPALPEMPPPLAVTVQHDPAGPGAVVFEKKGYFLQPELSAMVELFAKLAVKEGVAGSGASDPKKTLEELGAVLFEPSPDFTAERVAGYDDTKREVNENVVLPLLRPELFAQVHALARTRAGSSVPRAVLFEGPPGTGKTTMARILASQAGLRLIYVPIESIMSKWFGDSERRLDSIFDTAGKFDKSVVFLDEIDAFAGSRESGQMHEATRRILSVLLRQLQGLVDTSNVVVIGATNRKQDLDPALLSRFNRSIHFPLPNQDERAKILGYYAKHLGASDQQGLSQLCEGRSGREIEDGCGVAERMWASELIRTGAPASPPPVECYASAFRLKFTMGPAHAARA